MTELDKSGPSSEPGSIPQNHNAPTKWKRDGMDSGELKQFTLHF